MRKLTIMLPEDWDEKDDFHKQEWLEREFYSSKVDFHRWMTTVINLIALTAAVVALWLKALGVNV